MDTPINICFVTREYAHPAMGKTGGIGVFVKQFTKQLKKHNYQITVFTFGKDKLTLDDAGIKVVRVKDITRVRERITEPFRRYGLPGYITLKKVLEEINRRLISYKLSRFLKKNSFQMVEFHDYGGDTPYVKTKITKVVRCHGTATTLHQFMGYPPRAQDGVYEKKFFGKINKNIIAVSQFAAQTTQKAFNLKEKPEVIYNGVVLPELNTKSNYLAEPTVPFSIWYIGSVRERKGIDLACLVFNQIVEKYPEASFHVMGNNNNNHWNLVCVNLLTPKALEKTTYYGTVPNDQISSFLQKAHVVLFPSYGENFSIALLEVMAQGKVAITSKIPAFQEVMVHNKNGLIAEELGEYVQLLEYLFGNPESLETLSVGARQNIEQRFEMEKIIRQNIQYYKSRLGHGQ